MKVSLSLLTCSRVNVSVQMLPSVVKFPQFTTLVWNSCRLCSSKVWQEKTGIRLIQGRTTVESTVSGLTSSTLGTPARNPAGQAFSEGFSVVQTNGLDVVGQGGTSVQVKHSYVQPSDVAESDVCHVCCHLKGVGSILIQGAQNDGPLGCYRRAVE